MKWTSSILTLGLVAARLVTAQTDEDRRRISEFQDKLRDGEPVAAEYRAYMNAFNQLQRVEYPKTHPARESTGLMPLPDLGKGTYQGEQGGLYPGGENRPPAAHLAAGIKLAGQIEPLDTEGRPSNSGKILMISIGMSNTTGESQTFLDRLKRESSVNPSLLFVDCAQSGQVGVFTTRGEANYWKVAEERLLAAGVTEKQVQVAWLKQATAAPMRGFPEEARKLQGDLAGTVRVMHSRYPNLKIVYVSSRIYGGYATIPLNPEPYAYEGGFAVKWLIAGQIAGDPDLNYDSNQGPVKAPWLAWGPYLWADGLKGRSDGLRYWRDDLGQDGTHPSDSGMEKVAKLLLDFLKNDGTSRRWFVKR